MIEKIGNMSPISPAVEEIKKKEKRARTKAPKKEPVEQVDTGLNPWELAMKKQQIPVQDLIATGYDKFETNKGVIRAKTRVKFQEES